MKKFLPFIILIICCACCYENALDLTMQQFQRIIILDNGLTFYIKPRYRQQQLCVYMNISNGFARLNDGEFYDVHPIDSQGSDITSIRFYNKDFNHDFDSYKCTDIKPFQLHRITRFKMRYPAWVEDK